MFILKTCEISTKILSTLLIELNKIIISDNSEAYLMVFKAVAMSGASFFFVRAVVICGPSGIDVVAMGR